MPISSSIYSGVVVHRRLRPTEHLLRYKVFTVLLDLDELDTLGADLRMLSVNAPGILAFYEKDHGDGRTSGLRKWVDERLSEANVDRPESLRVMALCYPRILGYVFNPLTVYFCIDQRGRTVATLYQVNNTMGERHTYVIPLNTPTSGRYHQSCRKAMYVSPFTPMRGRYDFNVVPPGSSVVVGIRQSDDDGPLLNASFVGDCEALSDRALLRNWLRHPLMTAKVIAGIHWEAFLLWRKRIPFFKHEPQTNGDVSVVSAQPKVGAD